MAQKSLAQTFRTLGHLIREVLEGLHDFDTGLTPRLSFGPGRRLGLNGAHIVTVDLPDQRFYLVAPYKPITATP